MGSAALLARLEVEASGEFLEPTRPEAYVRNLFATDDLLRPRALLVARVAEACGKRGGVLEVRALEPQAHDRDERGGRRARRHALPEPVAHGKRADVVTEPFDLPRVETHVPRLIEGDPDEARAELLRGIREGEQRPGHQLGRLEFVMEERVQGTCATLRRRESARLRGLRDEDKLGRPSGSRDAPCDGPRFPARRRLRRGKLERERRAADVVPRPALDRVRLGLAHGQRLARTSSFGRPLRRPGGPEPGQRAFHLAAGEPSSGLSSSSGAASAFGEAVRRTPLGRSSGRRAEALPSRSLRAEGMSRRVTVNCDGFGLFMAVLAPLKRRGRRGQPVRAILNMTRAQFLARFVDEKGCYAPARAGFYRGPVMPLATESISDSNSERPKALPLKSQSTWGGAPASSLAFVLAESFRGSSSRK